MNVRHLLLGLFAWTMGCGGDAASARTPVLTAALSASPPPADSMLAASASAAAPTSSPPRTDVVPMYRVADVYSLIDVVATDGGLEVRLGSDPGGGALGQFRYVPFVNGAFDFARETSDVMFADSTGSGYISISGRRPHLFMHAVAGFRSAATESYSVLSLENDWGSAPVAHMDGLGQGIFTWSEDRLLEFRGPSREQLIEHPEAPQLPEMRIVMGPDKSPPSLPTALRKKLTQAGFQLATFTALETGEVVAVGELTKGEGFGTVSWTRDPKDPDYVVTQASGLISSDDLHILGGTSMSTLRLQVKDRVMRLEGNVWVEESIIPPNGFPDVWFGRPQIVQREQGPFARTTKGGPWLPLEGYEPGKSDTESTAVDAEGTLWMTVDETLYSSKKPSKTFQITEAALVADRKASLLRGGSTDVTGEPPHAYGVKSCRMHYVLFARSPIESAPDDYPKVRAALKGHTELAGAKFIVSREGHYQFFGAQIQDEDAANKLGVFMSKKLGTGSVYCAEPPHLREIHIDL